MTDERPPAGRYRLKVLATIAQHVVALVALFWLDGAPAIYLLLVLFDLGVSYIGPQLQSQGALATREFVAFADGFTERAFAWLLMPTLMAMGGMLFIASAALFLLPMLLATGVGGPLLDTAAGEWMMIVGSAMVISVAAAVRHDAAVAGHQSEHVRSRAGWLADQRLSLLGLFLLVATVALAAGTASLWLAAIVFAAVQCRVDIRALTKPTVTAR